MKLGTYDGVRVSWRAPDGAPCRASALRKKPAVTLKDFRRLYEAVQWFAEVRDGQNWKDDSIEIWFMTKSEATDDRLKAVAHLDAIAAVLEGRKF